MVNGSLSTTHFYQASNNARFVGHHRHTADMESWVQSKVLHVHIYIIF